MKSGLGTAAVLLLAGSGAALAQDVPSAPRIADPERPAQGPAASPLDRAEPGGSALRPANNPGRWITDTDYPTSAIMKNEEGTVSFSLDVAPDGTVSGCEITGGSAPANLKQLTCELITLRALFVPKRDEQGQAVEGVFDGTVRWQIPEGQPRQIAEGTQMMTYIVETDGSVSNCTYGEDDTPAPQICEFRSQSKVEPFRDANGEPVRKRVRHTSTVTIEDIEGEDIED